MGAVVVPHPQTGERRRRTRRSAQALVLPQAVDVERLLEAAGAGTQRRRVRREGRDVGCFRYGWFAARGKRAMDVVVSTGLLIASAPLLLAIALAIRLTSSGPALFRQERIGIAERRFTVLKFRTMVTDGDPEIHREYVTSMIRHEVDDSADGTFKLTADPRITRVGRWLRKTSLDELPQLYNVLRGDMSLVGPRPSLPYEVEEYADRQRLRAMSLPGITGLWQVEGRSTVHMLDALNMDLDYVASCSLRGDLVILAKTARVVLAGV